MLSGRFPSDLQQVLKNETFYMAACLPKEAELAAEACFVAMLLLLCFQRAPHRLKQVTLPASSIY